MKTCKICKTEKAESEFNVNRDKADGLHLYCKKCHGAKSAAWAKENPAKVKASFASWYANGRAELEKRRADEFYKKAWSDGYAAAISDGKTLHTATQ